MDRHKRTPEQRREQQRERQRKLRAANPELVNAYQHAAYAQRASAVATYKLEHGCMDCGYATDPVALDFDHRGNKFLGVSRMLTYSLDRLIDEMEKCDVVCSNCHRVRTKDRKHAQRTQVAGH